MYVEKIYNGFKKNANDPFGVDVPLNFDITHSLTLAFVAQRTHQDVRHIARYIHIIAQRSPTGASESTCFRTSIIFMRTFIKQITNFFARTTFWSQPIVQQL